LINRLKIYIYIYIYIHIYIYIYIYISIKGSHLGENSSKYFKINKWRYQVRNITNQFLNNLLTFRLEKLLYLPQKSIIDFLWNLHVLRSVQCSYLIFKNMLLCVHVRACVCTYVNKIFVNDTMLTHYVINVIDVFLCKLVLISF